MSAFREDLRDLAIDDLDYFFSLLSRHIFHLLFDSCFHLVSVLSLLANCNFESVVHQRLDVFLQVILMKSCDSLALARWNHQINELVARGSILVKYCEPVSKSIENNFVEVFRFYLPEALHSWSEGIPLRLWNKDS